MSMKFNGMNSIAVQLFIWNQCHDEDSQPKDCEMIQPMW